MLEHILDNLKSVLKNSKNYFLLYQEPEPARVENSRSRCCHRTGRLRNPGFSSLFLQLPMRGPRSAGPGRRAGLPERGPQGVQQAHQGTRGPQHHCEVSTYCLGPELECKA